jgi:hypothetical protein
MITVSSSGLTFARAAVQPADVWVVVVGLRPLPLRLARHGLTAQSLAYDLIAAAAAETGLTPRERAAAVLYTVANCKAVVGGSGRRAVAPDTRIGRFAWRHRTAATPLALIIGAQLRLAMLLSGCRAMYARLPSPLRPLDCLRAATAIADELKHIGAEQRVVVQAGGTIKASWSTLREVIKALPPASPASGQFMTFNLGDLPIRAVRGNGAPAPVTSDDALLALLDERFGKPVPLAVIAARLVGRPVEDICAEQKESHNVPYRGQVPWSSLQPDEKANAVRAKARELLQERKVFQSNPIGGWRAIGRVAQALRCTCARGLQ